MKKHVILSILLLSILGLKVTFAQGGIVSDPGSYAYYSQQITLATMTIGTIEQQVSFMQKAKEKLEMVNDKLKSIATIARAIRQTTITIKMIDNTIASIKKIKTVDPRIINSHVRRCVRLGERVSQNLSDMEGILRSNNLNMSDAERMTAINEKLRELSSVTSEANMIMTRMNQLERMNTWVTKL